MSEFLETFLRETPGPKPTIHLAAFGKHPGWNDHLDDFGFETESLVAAKQLIYLGGLAKQIDSAAWEELAPEKQLATFNHLILWTGRTGFIAGSMWSSQDGKGRSKYPMVICVQAIGLPPVWALKKIFPVLDQLKADCQATTSADEVKRILTEGRARIRAEIDGLGDPPSAAGIPVDRFGVGRPQLHRVLYEIQSQMAEMSPGNLKGRSPMEIPSRRLRVPALPADPAALSGWIRLVHSQLDVEVPLLGLAARGGGWLDFVAGKPQPQDFFCLRASAAQMPLTTEIPYTLETDFVQRADLVLDDLIAFHDSGRTIFGERPTSGFTMFPWASAGTGSRPPMEAAAAPPNSVTPPPMPVAPAHPSLIWVKVAFIVLAILVIAATVFVARRYG
jgi:hypothetical protein